MSDVKGMDNWRVMPLLLDENIRLREKLTELRAENERLRHEAGRGCAHCDNCETMECNEPGGW